jgi:hypothetical protein
MFALPTNPATREKLGDLSAVVEILRPDNKLRLPTLKQARLSAAAFLADNPSAKSVCSIFYSAAGDTLFGEFRRQSWKKLWKFNHM